MDGKLFILKFKALIYSKYSRLKIPSFFLFFIIMSGVSLVKGQQMVTRKNLPTLYYGNQDIQVCHESSLLGADKYSLKNIPDAQNSVLPKIVIHWNTDVANDMSSDDEFVDNTGGGYGPYINANHTIDEKEAITLYWVAGKVMEYYNTWGNIGISNKPTEVNTLRIGEKYYKSIGSFEILDKTLGLNKLNFDQGSKPYTLDVVGHEIAHGILRYHGINSPAANCDFGYIDESIADVFGILAKNYYLKQKNANAIYDWTHRMKFNNPLYDASNTLTIKSAGFPTAYKGVNYDQYCVDPHLNRTLLPYWFYLLSMGGSGHIDENPEKPSFTVTGIGVYRAEKILWRTITKFLPAYNTNSMILLDFREAVEQATIAEYGANSQELYAVRAAFFAVNIRLPSIPEEGAQNINPWPTAFEKIVDNAENKWAIDISEDKTFPNDPSKTYTKILMKGADTKIVNGKLSIVTSANLKPKTTYRWRVRPIESGNNSPGPTIDANIQSMNAEQDIRIFTTDERLVTVKHLDNPYPWGVPFTWNTLPSVPGSEIQRYIVNVFRQNESNPFIENFYTASANPTQSIPTDKPDYVVLQAGANYGWTVYAQGHDDVFGKNSYGSPNTHDEFKTMVPFTSLTFPADNALINPFDNTPQAPFPLFDLVWKRTLNAGKYRVQISKNKNMTNPIVDVEDNIGEYNTIKSFNPGPATDGNNKYYCQITPLPSALTNQSADNPETPELGEISEPLAFTYNYAITKPKLITSPSVTFLQPKISFKWKKVQGANYYKLSIAEKGLLGLANIINIDVIDNGSSEYEKIFDGDKLYPLDLALFANGYEWQVQAFKTSGSKDLPGEIAKSSYEIMRGESIILSPGDNDVLPVTSVQNSEIHYMWYCDFAPNGFEFKLGLAEANGDVLDLVTQAGVPLIFPPGKGLIANSLNLYENTNIAPLKWNTEYFAQFNPLSGSTSELKTKGQVRRFRTPKDPVSPNCADLGLAFNFDNAGGLPLNILIKNPDGKVFDFKDAVQNAVWNNQTFDMGPWGGNCGITGKVKPGNYQIQVQVFRDPGSSPNCTYNDCGSFTVGANGQNFIGHIYPTDYHKDRIWFFMLTIK